MLNIAASVADRLAPLELKQAQWQRWPTLPPRDFRNSGNLALLARKSGIPEGYRPRKISPRLKQSGQHRAFESKFQGEIDALALYPIGEGGTGIGRQGRFAGRRNAAQGQADVGIEPRYQTPGQAGKEFLDPILAYSGVLILADSGLFWRIDSGVFWLANSHLLPHYQKG